MDHSKILGTVLAGGKSQRFGEDKSQVQLGNQLLIDYVLAEIIDVFNPDGTLNSYGLHYEGMDRFVVRKKIVKELD